MNDYELFDLEMGPRVAAAFAESRLLEARHLIREDERRRALAIRTAPKGTNVPRSVIASRRAKNKRARRARKKTRAR